MWILPKGFGNYPPEYDRKIHGPYNPAVYYGKRDTPFMDVKLNELSAWIGRRNKSPTAMAQAISRTWWKYQLAWVQPLKPGPAFFGHFVMFVGVFFFVLDYHSLQLERRYRFH